MQVEADTTLSREQGVTSRIIRTLKTTVLDGPNSWSRHPVVYWLIDAGDAEGTQASRRAELLAGFALITGKEGSPDDDARTAAGQSPPPVNPGTILEALIFEMQIQAGDTIAFSRSRAAPDPGTYDVVCAFHEPQVAIAAGKLAVRTLNALLFQTERDFVFEQEFDRRLMGLVSKRWSRTQSDAVYRAARRRGIPVRYDPDNRQIVEMGFGAFIRRYWWQTTSKTSKLGGSISSSKHQTNQLLRELGLPVPESIIVRSAEEAVEAAGRIGYPVVVKPNRAMRALGVSIDVRTPDSVRRAFDVAMGVSRFEEAAVESYIQGDEYRILVVGDSVAAILRRVAAHVIGDGNHTIAQLIEIANADPNRGDGHATLLVTIAVDDDLLGALERQNLTLESFPEPGQHVRLKTFPQQRFGGTPVDHTDDIHPENAKVARLAAQALGIDICGIDLITPDLRQPVWKVGGAILEVNYSPGFDTHYRPWRGKPRDVGAAIVDMLYPPGAPVGAPVVAATGSECAAATCRTIARIMQVAGRNVGLTTVDETSVEGTLLRNPRLAGETHHRMILRNPNVDFAVLQVVEADVAAQGLAFETCDVAVVTRSAPAAPVGLRTVESVVLGTAQRAVVDADDPQLAELMANGPGNLILTGTDSTNDALRAHLAGGGAAVTVVETGGEPRIAHWSGKQAIPIVSVAQILRFGQEDAEIAIRAALAAVGAAMAMEVPVETIHRVLVDPASFQ